MSSDLQELKEGWQGLATQSCCGADARAQLILVGDPQVGDEVTVAPALHGATLNKAEAVASPASRLFRGRRDG